MSDLYSIWKSWRETVLQANLAGGLSRIGLVFLFPGVLVSAPAGRLDLGDGEWPAQGSGSAGGLDLSKQGSVVLTWGCVSSSGGCREQLVSTFLSGGCEFLSGGYRE